MARLAKVSDVALLKQLRGAEEWCHTLCVALLHAQGLVTLGEALPKAETHADVFWAAELHRLKGELTPQKFPVPSSELQVRTRRVGKAHQNVSIAKAGMVGGAHPTGEAEKELREAKALLAAFET
jgi:hypothetical protein